MVAGWRGTFPITRWCTLAGAALALACGSSERTDPSNATGGGAGAANPSGGSGASSGAGGSGDAGTSAGGKSGAGAAGAGTGSGGEGASSGSSSSSGSGGESTAGAAGSDRPIVGDGERDETCMLRTSQHAAGSRIVLRNAVTAEGDAAFLGFYDSEKGMECDVRQDAEGTFRCMPLTRGDKDTRNVYFLDDQCEEQVDYRGICALAHDAVPVTSDPCDKRRRFYALGEPLPNSLVYSRNSEGVCEPYGTLNNLRTLGPEIDPREFAEVEPVVWRGKGRIWAEGYRGEDGLEIVTGLLDSELGERCDFERLSGGDEHCTPVSRGILGFTDPSCQEALMTYQTTCDAALPRYASRSVGDACNQSPSFVAAGDAYRGELYLESSCMPATNMSASTFTTAPVPDSAFAAVETTIVSSDPGRLKPMYRNAADGGCFFRDFWDEELETACSFEADNSTTEYFCQPLPDPTTHGETLRLFSDAACVNAAVYVKMPACDGAKVPKFTIEYASRCVHGWREVRPVDPAPAELPALWVDAGDTCTPYTPEANAAYHAAGDIMPASMFVQAAREP